MMLKKRPIRLLSFLSGLCFALPFLFRSALSAPIAYFSGIPALFLLFSYLTDGVKRRLTFYLRMGFYFGFGYHIGVYHWFLAMYPLDFIESLTPVTAALAVLVAHVGLSLVASLCFTFIIPNVALFARTRTVRAHSMLLPPLFAAVFTVFSFLISLTFMGVPWGMLAITQVVLPPLAMTASLLGGYLVTFIVVLVEGYLALALLCFLRARKSGMQTKKDALRPAALPLLLATAIFLANLAAGTALYLTPHKNVGEIRATLVQGNVSSRQKWNGEGESLYDRYDRIVSSLADTHSDLIVWSETAITTSLDRTPLALGGKSVSAWLAELSQKTGAYQLVGAFTYEGTQDAPKSYNSLYLVRPDGSVSDTVYHKRHLVPFGEYVPWKSFINTVLPFMAELVLTNEFTAGTDSSIYTESALGGNIGALICFDSIYEPLARDSVRDGAELLVISTNDSWFDDSAALYQHNAQAILRAIENGRCVLRAANTGISSVITDKGVVVASLAPNVEGTLTETVPCYGYTTLYTAVGNLFIYLCIAALLCLPLPDFFGLIKKARMAYHEHK